MNAQEMYKALNTVSACDGLDKWIEHILFDRMQKSVNMTVTIDTKVECPTTRLASCVRWLTLDIR